MSVDAAAVAAWIGDGMSADKLRRADEVCTAVVNHAAKRYEVPTDPDDLAQYEHALVMQAARLALRFQSITGRDVQAADAPIVVRFDPDVSGLLADFLKTGYLR